MTRLGNRVDVRCVRVCPLTWSRTSFCEFEVGHGWIVRSLESESAASTRTNCSNYYHTYNEHMYKKHVHGLNAPGASLHQFWDFTGYKISVVAARSVCV